MNNEGLILDLVFNGTGRCAADLTHDLSVVGNGDMAEGITQIADFCVSAGYEAGKKFGTKKGICIGLAITFVGLGTHVIYKRHIKKIERQAAMWQRFEDQGREADKKHWAEYEELKVKAEKDATKEEETEKDEA